MRYGKRRIADVGDMVRIDHMEGEPQYTGEVGVIDHIDAIGQLHGTWGGCAIIPDVDSFTVISRCAEGKSDSHA